MHRGFSLLETVIVIALMSALVATTAYVGLGTYNRILALTSGEDVSAHLRAARGSSMRGMCYGPACAGAEHHGVRLTDATGISFEGSAFESRTTLEDFPFTHSLLLENGLPIETVFSKDSVGGSKKTISFTNENSVKEIQVFPAGGIWQYENTNEAP